VVTWIVENGKKVEGGLAPFFKAEDLYVGQRVQVLHNMKLCRAVVERVHRVHTERFPVGQFPEESRRGGCDFATRDGKVCASLRTYSEDGDLTEDCRNGCCVHVKFRNGAKAIIGVLAFIRPLNNAVDELAKLVADSAVGGRTSRRTS
jgi:hypothetical protein